MNDPYIDSLKNEIELLRAANDNLRQCIAYADFNDVTQAIKDLHLLMNDCNLGNIDQHLAPSLQIAIDALVPHRDLKALEGGE